MCVRHQVIMCVTSSGDHVCAALPHTLVNQHVAQNNAVREASCSCTWTQSLARAVGLRFASVGQHKKHDLCDTLLRRKLRQILKPRSCRAGLGSVFT